MGIAVVFDASMVQSAMTDEQRAAGQNGALDPEDVYFQYLCTTVDGGHNPDLEPDDRVRPEHAALHATVWRIDDPLAPVPPLDYGCRCAMRHVGKPGSTAARVLKAEAETQPTTRAQAYAAWLDQNASGWRPIAEQVGKVAATLRLPLAIELAKQAGLSDPSSIARMIVATLPPEKPKE